MKRTNRRTTERGAGARLGLPALALAVAVSLAAAPAFAASDAEPDGETGMLMNYVVNGDTGKAAAKDVKKAIKDAGGVVISQYKKIGVTVAQSSRNKFAKDLRKLDIVDSVGATRTSPVDADLAPKADDVIDGGRKLIDPEPLEGQQWGNTKLESLAANEIEDGKKSVIVGIMDSGSNDLHEDLAANFDTDLSVDCQSQNGVPNTEFGAWRALREHGTHTMGTVGAARNGIGVAGIAPGIKLVSLKVSNDDGFYFPEYVLCGYWWALKHGVDITNNSYFVDPWMFWCKDDPDQGAVQESFHRMITYTQKKGMVHVAAAGNAAYDLANKTTDSSSPNDSTPIFREINNDCLDIPAEIKGVITVSAIQQSGTKASFSNYGEGVIDVAAPGVNILSTGWPGSSDYHSLSGTSMASPHVTGVIALMESVHPGWSLKKITKRLYKDSVDQGCGGASGCTGPEDNNGFYGRGIVNALNAVS